MISTDIFLEQGKAWLSVTGREAVSLTEKLEEVLKAT